jgi:hypothetical protein
MVLFVFSVSPERSKRAHTRVWFVFLYFVIRHASRVKYYILLKPKSEVFNSSVTVPKVKNIKVARRRPSDGTDSEKERKMKKTTATKENDNHGRADGNDGTVRKHVRSPVGPRRHGHPKRRLNGRRRRDKPSRRK